MTNQNNQNITKTDQNTKSTNEITAEITKTKKPKIGILNGGGDCPGLNTVIDAVVKSLENEFELIGFLRGFEGLYANDWVELNSQITSRNRWIGGSILKSVNKGNFPGKIAGGEFNQVEQQIIQKTLEVYKNHELQGLVVLGGDGTLYTAYQLQEFGFKVIGIPKSIDNDLEATDYTFGFQTAVEIANEALGRLHTTGQSHDRVMILEVMGRNAGWIALNAGIAGSANIILLPEIPFRMQKVVEVLEARKKLGKLNSTIVVSEAAHPTDHGIITKNVGKETAEIKLGGIGDFLEKYINQNTSFEARSTVLGHIQRGGSPNAFDKVLSTQLGSFAGIMLKNGQFGQMAALQNGKIVAVPLGEAVFTIKNVQKDSQILELARNVGISFGE